MRIDLNEEQKLLKDSVRQFAEDVVRPQAKEIDETGEEISLEGETREMSVLFSDVRDFTSISEGLDPTELTALMNIYSIVSIVNCF